MDCRRIQQIGWQQIWWTFLCPPSLVLNEYKTWWAQEGHHSTYTSGNLIARAAVPVVQGCKYVCLASRSRSLSCSLRRERVDELGDRIIVRQVQRVEIEKEGKRRLGST